MGFLVAPEKVLCGTKEEMVLQRTLLLKRFFVEPKKFLNGIVAKDSIFLCGTCFFFKSVGPLTQCTNEVLLRLSPHDR